MWRNLMAKGTLKQGMKVKYEVTDDSLSPTVCSGDSCYFEPVGAILNTLEVDDIIFCQNKEDGEFQVQKIKEICWEYPAASASALDGSSRRRYVFGNYMRSGYAHDDQVYGRLVAIGK